MILVAPPFQQTYVAYQEPYQLFLFSGENVLDRISHHLCGYSLQMIKLC